MTKSRSAYEILQVRDDAHQLIIQAAYRVLAGMFHPDTNRDAGAERRMAEINTAYADVRTPDRREAYDRLRRAQANGPAPANAMVTPPPSRTSPAPSSRGDSEPRLDFGRYVGWTLRDLARKDPDYLRWLSRHSSGLRYRTRIDDLLRSLPPRTTASERVRGR